MIVEVSLHARTTFLTLSPEVFYIILALRSKSSHPYPLVFLLLFLRPILRTKPRIRYAHDSLNARHCRSFRCCFTLKFAAAILSVKHLCTITSISLRSTDTKECKNVINKTIGYVGEPEYCQNSCAANPSHGWLAWSWCAGRHTAQRSPLARARAQ